MTITIDADKALELLTEVVEEHGGSKVYKRPENLYSGGVACFYSHGTEAGCIVGQALAKVGVPLSALAQMDHCNGDSTAIHDESVLYLLGEIGFELTHAAVDVFAAAQARQDSGQTWGTALLAARNEHLIVTGVEVPA